MDPMQIDGTEPRVPPPLDPNLSYDEKWEVLKPYLKYLYLDQGLPISKVAARIKEHRYPCFHAV